jgi:ATP-dependent RNA helicase SUPV3L1/SUV3
VPAEEAQAHLAALEAAQAETGGEKAAGPVVEVVASRTAADRPLKKAAAATPAGGAPEPATPETEETATGAPLAVETSVTGTQPDEANAAPESASVTEKGGTTGAVENEPADASAGQATTEPASAPADEAKASSGTSPEAAGEATAEEQEEPRPVLLWRPGGRSDGHRGQRHGAGEGQGRRDGGRRHGGEAGRNADDAEGSGKGAPGKGGRGKQARHGGKPGGGKAGHGKGAPGKGGDGNRGPRNDRAPRKEKPVDPDSPFAALAALRDKMKK